VSCYLPTHALSHLNSTDALDQLVNLDKIKMETVLFKGRIQVSAGSTPETANLLNDDIKKAAKLWFETLRASSGRPVLIRSVSSVHICPESTFDAVLRDLENANLLFTFGHRGDSYVIFHDPRQMRTFEMLVPVPDAPRPHLFLRVLPQWMSSGWSLRKKTSTRGGGGYKSEFSIDPSGEHRG
jgi:hypothetical protein